MGLWNEIGNTISRTVDTVIEATERAAQYNRLKMILKSESDAVTRAYIALGKHYYNNLRNPENKETECLCQAVDHAKDKIGRVKNAMEEAGMRKECGTEKKTVKSASGSAAGAQAAAYEPDAGEDIEIQAEDDFHTAEASGHENGGITAPAGGPQEAADEADELIPPLTDLDIQD